MTECRTYSPDLILLNHRLKLGSAQDYATTFLWEGAETYIDVHMANWSRAAWKSRLRVVGTAQGQCSQAVPTSTVGNMAAGGTLEAASGAACRGVPVRP